MTVHGKRSCEAPRQIEEHVEGEIDKVLNSQQRCISEIPSATVLDRSYRHTVYARKITLSVPTSAAPRSTPDNKQPRSDLDDA